MPRCFMIQPFDDGKFDKRYREVFKPAIEAAGLEPYRVDLDPTVEVPIDAIEEGIKSAAICLAEITTDNPNVWYELGFGRAAGRPTVMLCSDERTGGRFPFDIQHRSIIIYKSEAPSDHESLGRDITAKLIALLEKGAALRQVAQGDQVAPLSGLSHIEIAVLASLAGSVTSPGGVAALASTKNDAEQAGLTGVAFSLGVWRLQKKDFIAISTDSDSFGNTWDAIQITDEGWAWIARNESLFVLRRLPRNSGETQAEIADDDIPF